MESGQRKSLNILRLISVSLQKKQKSSTVTATTRGWETNSMSNCNHPHTLIPSLHTWISWRVPFDTLPAFLSILSLLMPSLLFAMERKTVSRSLQGLVQLTRLILQGTALVSVLFQFSVKAWGVNRVQAKWCFLLALFFFSINSHYSFIGSFPFPEPCYFLICFPYSLVLWTHPACA